MEPIKKSAWRRFLPLIFIALLMVAAWWSGAFHALSLMSLKEHRQAILQFVDSHPASAPLAFMAIYFVCTSLSIPGAIWLTLLGGLLFTQPQATLYVVVGATAGATALFLAARTAFGTFLAQKAGSRLKSMEEGLRKNAASYLLFLRFVPLFPFWMVNLAPAFFGVKARTFVWTTLVGILPGSYVFTQAGAGLGSLLDNPENFSLSTLLTTQVKIALVALGLFALLPIFLKKLFKKKAP
jgi:uncharacterized membrane protein YdjX (TVP38/TMEM64 family)